LLFIDQFEERTASFHIGGLQMQFRMPDVKIGHMNREEMDSVIQKPACSATTDLRKAWQSAS